LGVDSAYLRIHNVTNTIYLILGNSIKLSLFKFLL
jgi:hypothetical protein